MILSICSANFTVGFPWRPEIRIEMKFPSGPNFYGNLKPPTSFQKLSSAFRTSAVRHVGELIETFFKKSGPDWHFDLNSNGWDWTIWGFRAGIAHIVPKVSFSTFHTQLELPVSKLYSALRISAIRHNYVILCRFYRFLLLEDWICWVNTPRDRTGETPNEGWGQEGTRRPRPPQCPKSAIGASEDMYS